MLEALQIPDVEKVLQGQPPPPDPKVIIEGEKLKLERDKLEFEMAKFEFEKNQIEATTQKILAQAIESIAKAEAAELGPQLEIYKAQLQAIGAERKAAQSGSNQAGMGKMAQ